MSIKRTTDTMNPLLCSICLAFVACTCAYGGKGMGEVMPTMMGGVDVMGGMGGRIPTMMGSGTTMMMEGGMPSMMDVKRGMPMIEGMGGGIPMMGGMGGIPMMGGMVRMPMIEGMGGMPMMGGIGIGKKYGKGEMSGALGNGMPIPMIGGREMGRMPLTLGVVMMPAMKGGMGGMKVPMMGEGMTEIPLIGGGVPMMGGGMPMTGGSMPMMGSQMPMTMGAPGGMPTLGGARGMLMMGGTGRGKGKY